MKLIIIVLFLAMSLNATTYYLRADGDDNANGLTLTTAFATFDTAAVYLTPGDVLICDGSGGYYQMTANDTVTITGTTSQWIKVIGVNNFRIANETGSNLSIVFYGNYIEFNGLHVYGDVSTAKYMNMLLANSPTGFPKSFRVYNCYFKQSGMTNEGVGPAPNYWSGNVHVRGCSFYNAYTGPSLSRFVPSLGSSWTVEYCTFSGGSRSYYTINNNGRGFTAYRYNIVEDVTNVFDLNGAATLTITDINDRHKYNIYWNYTTFCADGAGADTITVQPTELDETNDPLIESPSTMNFYLQKDSPARYFAPRNVTIGAKEVVSFTTKGR